MVNTTCLYSSAPLAEQENLHVIPVAVIIVAAVETIAVISQLSCKVIYVQFVTLPLFARLFGFKNNVGVRLVEEHAF